MKDVDYADMKVFEGQGYAIARNVEEVKNMNTSKLFTEVAEDYFSGWRDFVFMPEPPEEVIQGVIQGYIDDISELNPVAGRRPVLVCPVGLVASGKTSTTTKVIGDMTIFPVSSDRIRTQLYREGYNFRGVESRINTEVLRYAAKKKIDILIDSNSGSKLDLIKSIAKGGYHVITFHINSSDEYIENKINNMDFSTMKERFDFFKIPAHVMSSYKLNRGRMKINNAVFLRHFPADFTISPETLTPGELSEHQEQFRKILEVDKD